jgi:hypothetical protein
MAKYDVVVIGAGAAGLTAGALLAKQGKRVVVMDREKHLGGRAMAVPFEGYRLSLGGHLLEDGGSGITKIISYLGGELKHGLTSKGMPVWVDGKWQSIQSLYSTDKNELKKVIKILCDTDWKELDKWDDKPMREWLLQYTTSEGVIALFEYIACAECLTDKWWDHSASDNLYTRKMHYMERRVAGYSCWPEGGWHGIFDKLAASLKANGGDLWTETSAQKVIIENGRVKGVAFDKGPKAMMTEGFNWDVIEADAVISTLPVWNVLNVVPEKNLPDWYATKIKTLAADEYKVCWLGMYVASHEPIFTGLDPTELAIWFDSANSRLPGWAFLAFTSTTAGSLTRERGAGSGSSKNLTSSRKIWRRFIPTAGPRKTSFGSGGTWCSSRPSECFRSRRWSECFVRTTRPRGWRDCGLLPRPSARAALAWTARRGRD